MLTCTDNQASAKWDQLDDAQLAEEIELYRQSVGDIIRVLEGLGVAVSADEEQAEDSDQVKETIAGVEVLTPNNNDPFDLFRPLTKSQHLREN